MGDAAYGGGYTLARMQAADIKPTLKRISTDLYGFVRIMRNWKPRTDVVSEIPQTPVRGNAAAHGIIAFFLSYFFFRKKK